MSEEREERRGGGGRRRGEDERPKLDLKVRIDVIGEIAMMRTCCLDEKARRTYAPVLPPDYYLGPGHAELWGGIVELHRRGLDYSRDVMQSILGEERAATLDAYVSRPGPVESARNLVEIVNALKWDKARADVAGVLVPEFYEVLRDPTADPETVQRLAEKIGKALRVRDLRYLRSTETVWLELERELRARMENRAIVPFGIPDLDKFGPDDFVEKKVMREDGTTEIVTVCLDGYPRIIPGCAPTMISLVTGESGSGKTVFTANGVAGLIAQKKRVLWGAWEQQSKNSLELIGEILTGMSRSDMWAGVFGDAEIDELRQISKHLGDFLKFFENPFGRAANKTKFRSDLNERNFDVIQEHVITSGCDVAVLDVYRDALEEMRPEDEIRAIKRAKGIALEGHTHLMLVQHINVKQADGGKPKRGNVMGTGDWINKADNAFAMWADRERHKLEIHILKQRHGRWPLAVELDCNFEFSHIGRGRSLVIKDEGEHSEMDDFLGGNTSDRGASSRKGRKRN